MALQVTKIERSFLLKKNGKETPLSDPNPEMNPEEVMKYHSAAHPELTNGIIEGPVVKGDKSTYTLTTKAGKLG